MPKIVKVRDLREIELRRHRVLTLYVKGKTVQKILKELGIGVATASDDLKAIRESILQNQDNLTNAIIEEISLSIIGLNEALRRL